MSRSATSVQVPQATALSALAQQFEAQTPYFVNFDFDVDALDAEAKARLDAQAAWIIDHPNVKFRVYGHADKVGSVAYNHDLGLRRATNAVTYLVSKGIDPIRLEAMVSFGEEAPIVDTEGRERANRRVVTEVFAFLVQVPSVADGSDLVSVSISDPTAPEQAPEPDPTPEPDPAPEEDSGDGKKPNSGRGNGDEAGDPGNSGGKNNGGDDV